MQNQQSCTELTLDGVHRGIRRNRTLEKTLPGENVPLTYKELYYRKSHTTINKLIINVAIKRSAIKIIDFYLGTGAITVAYSLI